MIVTCPECSTRYLVDAHALGATGRLVRCAQCAHTWHQAPPVDAPRRVDLAGYREPMLGNGDRLELPEPPPERRRRYWAAASSALLVLLLVAVAAAAVWKRDVVVSHWPAAARFYALVRLPVSQPGTGLQLRNVQPSRTVENGLPTLVIQGEVVNTSAATRDIPKLKVILRDARDQELQSWYFTVPEETLAPGASVAFRTSVSQPNEGATGVMVTFTANGG